MTQIQLTSPNPFYESTTYLSDTQKDFASPTPLSPPYILEKEHKIIQIAKIIFAIIVFPVGLYKTFHFILGRILIKSSRCSKKRIDEVRKKIPLDTEWRFKRVTLEVNGRSIDGIIMVRTETAGNGQWMVVAQGRNGYYERKVTDVGLRNLLLSKNMNAFIFNYPGVGRSEGPTTRANLLENCKAAFTFVEKHLHATSILGYGYSMGGGVISETIATLPSPEKGVTRRVLLDRTFCKLSKATAWIYPKPIGLFLGSLVRVCGWELRTSRACKRNPHLLVVLQTTTQDSIRPIKEFEHIRHDGIIHPEATLTLRVLGSSKIPNISIIGISGGHNTPLTPDIVDAICI